MNNSYREIEKKFRFKGVIDFQDAAIGIESKLLWQNVPYRSIPICTTRDTYWLPPAESSLQFVRVRDSQGTGADGEYKSLKELTIKQRDMGSNLNRLEINLAVDSTVNANELVSRLVGESEFGEIRKNEAIWFVQVDGGEVVLSLADVNGELFFEVEGPTVEYVEQYCKLFNGLVPEPRSLFEIFIRDQKPVGRTIYV